MQHITVELSDMTNLTRAKDAVACFMEPEERCQRGRHSPSEGRLCVKTDSWGSDRETGSDNRTTHWSVHRPPEQFTEQ
jgi:hypothetical protein